MKDATPKRRGAHREPRRQTRENDRPKRAPHVGDMTSRVARRERSHSARRRSEQLMTFEQCLLGSERFASFNKRPQHGPTDRRQIGLHWPARRGRRGRLRLTLAIGDEALRRKPGSIRRGDRSGLQWLGFSRVIAGAADHEQVLLHVYRILAIVGLQFATDDFANNVEAVETEMPSRDGYMNLTVVPAIG